MSRRYNGNRESNQSTTFSANEQLCKTPENVGEFQIQGDTLQTCSHNHINILQEGCSDIQTGLAPCSLDEVEQVEQPLYEWNPSQNQDNDEIPQNLLEALGLDYDWETENEWICLSFYFASKPKPGM